MSEPLLLTGASWALCPEPLRRPALLIRDGRIADLGPAAEVEARHAGLPRRDVGPGWLLPGLRNGHGHVAGWTRDAPVEVFLLTRYGAADADAMYRACLRTALGLARSGVTSTHHLHYGPFADAVAAAYRQVGIRLQLCPGALDRYAIVPYDDGDRRLLASLPPALAARAAAQRLGKPTEPVERYLERWHALRAAEHGGLVEVILGPDNPQWCSDACLTALAAVGAPMHLHVQETPLQRSAAVRATDMSPVRRLDRLGLLREDTTLAHLTAVDDDDLRRVAASGAAGVVNASSNLRLGSGVPPIRRLAAAGIPFGLGTDGGGFADDLDHLAELRIATLLQRAERGPAPEIGDAAMLARACGRLEVGADADLVVLEGHGREGRASAIVTHATARDVRDVYVGGERIVHGGVPVHAADPDPEPESPPSEAVRLALELEPYVRRLLEREAAAA